ncbi:MAG: hypothetical protein AB1403_13295 [Candidatus Riflebacteria bacterium]
MSKTLPRGYQFPLRLPGESYKDYAIRIKVHPSCKDRVSLHPDDLGIKDITDQVIDRGYIITCGQGKKEDEKPAQAKPVVFECLDKEREKTLKELAKSIPGMPEPHFNSGFIHYATKTYDMTPEEAEKWHWDNCEELIYQLKKLIRYYKEGSARREDLESYGINVDEI